MHVRVDGAQDIGLCRILSEERSFLSDRTHLLAVSLGLPFHLPLPRSHPFHGRLFPSLSTRQIASIWPLFPPPSHTAQLSPSVSLCFSLSLCLSVCLSVCLSLSVSQSVSQYLSVSLYLSRCLSLSVSFSLSVSLSFSLSSVSINLSLCLSVSLGVSLNLSDWA